MGLWSDSECRRARPFCGLVLLQGPFAMTAFRRFILAPAAANGWTVVDMKKDWNKVFAFQ
jgi:hypothetical protein